jgi:hypothetical protein
MLMRSLITPTPNLYTLIQAFSEHMARCGWREWHYLYASMFRPADQTSRAYDSRASASSFKDMLFLAMDLYLALSTLLSSSVPTFSTEGANGLDAEVGIFTVAETTL